MSAHDEAVRRIRRARETGAAWLDLGDLGLEELPAEISELPVTCRTLALGEMRPVFWSGKLEWIRGGENDPSPKWRDLESLSLVPFLSCLDLSGCLGAPDLSPLAALTSVRSINLSGSRHLTDISSLSGLSSLEQLDLGYCAGLTDLSALSGLALLEWLCLDGCHDLADLSLLGDLPSLTSLHCMASNLPDLGELSRLISLVFLNIQYFRGRVDLDRLAGLAHLRTLDLGCTHVSDLSPLSCHSSLESLYLCHCRDVVDISPLSRLVSLSTLDLTGCTGLRTIEPLWPNLANIRELFLHGCCDLDLPPEFYWTGHAVNVIDPVKAHYIDQSFGRTADTELKVFVLGNGGVGKTRLCNSIRPDGKPFDVAIPTTHGIELGRLICQIPNLPVPARLNLWDFGGQDIYHGAHALFMQEQAVFLVLWHPDKERGTYTEGDVVLRHQPLAYWLDYIRGLAGTNVAVLVVQSQCEDESQKRKPDVDVADWGFAYSQALQFSARTGWGKDILEAHLRQAVQFILDSRPVRTIGIGRAQVAEKLRQMHDKDQKRPPEKRKNRTLTLEVFRQICHENGKVTAPDALLDFLHHRGVVFYRRGLFSDRIILDQNWAMAAIYAVFHRQLTLPILQQLHGRFTRQLLARLIWDGQGHSADDQKLFLTFMESCGICFRVRDLTPERYSDKEYEYLAPELMPAWTDPESELMDRLVDAPKVPGVRVRFGLLHEGILRRFLSKIGTRAGDKAQYWKFGCYFYDANSRSKVLIKSAWDDPANPRGGEVALTAWGERPEQPLDTLVKELTSIPLRTPPEVIRAAPAAPRPEPAASLESLRPEIADPRTLGRDKVYLSYAWGEDATEAGRQREAVVDRLVPLLVGDGYEVFRDKTAMRHGDLISKFMLAIGMGSRIVVVLSEKYLRSPYCIHELHLIHRRACGDKDEFLKRIVTVVLDDARIDGWRNRADWAKHWQQEFAEMTAHRDHLGIEDEKQRRLIEHWHKDIGDILSFIADTLAPRGFGAACADDFVVVRAMLRR